MKNTTQTNFLTTKYSILYACITALINKLLKEVFLNDMRIFKDVNLDEKTMIGCYI